MAPHVAIILPAYNAAAFIRAALASVAGQTYDQWELIVIDDGSTDDTAGLVAQAPGAERRHVIRQPNQGESAARNAGLAAVQAELVAFLDADDCWQPGYLSQMCNALDQAPQAVACFGGWQYMDEQGRPLSQAVLLSPEDLGSLDEDLLWRNSIIPSSLVTRRSALLTAGGFDETLQACTDWDMWLRLKAIGPFIALPQVLTWYRAHAASMTENVSNIERERLRVNSKYLGPLDEPLERWPTARRRAVGYTYFNTALGYLRQHDIEHGHERLRQAAQHWPGLLELPEFYYELGCAFQPRGLRGAAQGLDLTASAALIQALLFRGGMLPGAASPWPYWGRACLTLASLARDTGNRRACWSYTLRALPHVTNPQRALALRLFARCLVPSAFLLAARRGRSARSAVSPRPA